MFFPSHENFSIDLNNIRSFVNNQQHSERVGEVEGEGEEGSDSLLFNRLLLISSPVQELWLSECCENYITCSCLHVILASNAGYLLPLLVSLNSIQLNANGTHICFHVVVDEGEISKLEAILRSFIDTKLHPVELLEWKQSSSSSSSSSSQATSPLSGDSSTSLSPSSSSSSSLSPSFTQGEGRTRGVDLERLRSLIRVWGKDGLPMHSNTFNYIRFYLPSLFPNLCTIVYLDPDTLVQADLKELHQLFFQQTKVELHPQQQKHLDTLQLERESDRDKQERISNERSREEKEEQKERGEDRTGFFGAVEAYASTVFRSSYGYLVKCKRTEIKEVVKNCSDIFFNAGVFITDLKRWREEETTKHLEKWLEKNRERQLWRWGSQAPLAVEFYQKWFRLPLVWNFRRFKDLQLLIQGRRIRAEGEVGGGMVAKEEEIEGEGNDEEEEELVGDYTLEDLLFGSDSGKRLTLRTGNKDEEEEEVWRVTLKELKVLHFAGKRKPWQSGDFVKVPRQVRQLWCHYYPDKLKGLSSTSPSASSLLSSRTSSEDWRYVWSCNPYPTSPLDYGFLTRIF